MTGIEKFRKKIKIETIIKSIIIGIILSLISTAIIMLALKLNAIDIFILYYILIFFGSAVLFSTIAYFIIKPNKIKMAKRIDNQLDLKQKIETMVTYENEDNVILQLQREDAKNAIENISIKSFKMKFHYLLWVSLVVALSFGIVGICVPAKASSSDGDKTEEQLPPDFVFDEWLKFAIEELITYVNDSNVNASTKASYVEELNTLMDNLEECQYQSDAAAFAKGTINNLENILNNSIVSDDVAKPLLSSSGQFVVLLAKNLDYLNVTNALKAVDNMRYNLNVSNVEGDAAFDEACASFKKEFTEVFKSYEGDKTKNLYITINNLSNCLDKALAASDVQASITESFNEANAELQMILSEEYVNFSTEKYVKVKLEELFGLPSDEEPNNSVPDPGQSSTDEEEGGDDGSGGGGGTGDTIYASNDKFFDPIKGEVVYGDVIDDYYARIIAMYNEGLITEEYKDYCIKYFQYLYGSANDKDEN